MHSYPTSRGVTVSVSRPGFVGFKKHVESPCARTRVISKLFAYLSLLAFGGVFCNFESRGQVIQLVSAPGKFYVDDKAGNGVVYNYAAYLISNNTASTFPSIYVAITNIVNTNRIQLASTDSGVRALGSLAPGQSKMAAFYLKGPSFTGNTDTLLGLTNENHTIRVLTGPPGLGSVLTSANYSFTNIIYVIEALANKVTIITNLNPAAVIGSQVLLVIAGDTGTIGGQNSISFSPAVLNSWRPDCYELDGAQVVFTQNPTFTNQLYFDPSVSGFTNFAGQSYTNTFYFRAVKATVTNLAISPFAFVDSGSGTKHTALTSLVNAGGSNIIYSATNVVNITTQTVSPSSLLAPGGTVTYSVVFTNFSTGVSNVTLDEIVDVLPGTPGNFSYIPGSAAFNSSPVADPTIVGQALHWAIPFTIPANAVSVLSFQAVAPAPAGQYTNSAYGLIGSSQIDTTADPSDNSPSRTVFTIIPVSDVAIGKTAPASVVAAANFNYTISVTNFGPSPLTGLCVTDTLPAGLGFVSASSGGFLSGGQVIWTNLPTVASNAVTTLTLTMAAPANAASLTNVASAGSPILDPDTNNNTTPPVFTTVTASADVSAGKTGPASVNAGANFNYTIWVTNLGPSVATNLSVTDSIPAGVSFVLASGGGVFGSGRVVWNLGDFPAGSWTNFVLTVAAPASGGSLSNSVTANSSVADPNPTNNTSLPVLTSVVPVADIAIGKSAPVTATPSANFAYVIAVTNLGPSPASGISVTDNLPAGVTFVSADSGGVLSGSRVVWTNLTLPGGAVTNLSLNVTAPANPANLTNTATAGSAVNDPNPTNNTSSPVITFIGASADLAVTKSGPASVPAGNNFNYTITVSNLGPSTAPSITVTDALPGNVTFVSASAGGVFVGTAVIWTNFASLPANSATNLTLTVTAPADGAQVTNTATVSSPVPDPNSTNNTAAPAVTTVFDNADVALGKSGPAANPLPGSNFDYTISVTNFGPSTASSVTVTDVLPANVTFVTASAAGILSGGEVVWNLGNISQGGVTNLTLTVTAPLIGGITNTATVGSPTSDPNPTNNATPPVTTVVSNVPPVAVNDSANTTRNVPVTIPVLANDSDANGDVLTIVGVSSTNGNAVINGTNILYTPSGSFAGRTYVTYTITDGQAGTNSASIAITVIDRAPVANADTYTSGKNTTLNVGAPGVLANDTDADLDTLTAVKVSDPAHGTVTLNSDGSFVYVPVTNYFGPDSFTYQASDGLTNSTTVTVTLTITNINRAPVANADAYTSGKNTTLNISAPGVLGNDTDADLDTLTAIKASDPAHGTVTLNSDGSFIYIPVTNYFGADSFTYQASDGITNSATVTVTFTITNINRAPVANADAYTSGKNTTLNVSAPGVLANDTDADLETLSAVKVSDPAHGTVTLNSDGSFVYVPVTNFFGADSFTYQASDGITNSATVTVTLTITNINRAPIATADAFTSGKNMTLNVSAPGVLGNDTDADVDTLTAIKVSDPAHGTVTLNTDGSFVYVPVTNYFGPDSFTYQASDGMTNSATVTVTLTITNINRAPVATADAYTSGKNTTLNVGAPGVLANDTDADVDTLTAIKVSDPAHGTVTLNSDGSFIFVPVTNYFGPDSFTYQASDGMTNSATVTVALMITNINRAPVANADTYTSGKNTTLNASGPGVLSNDTDADVDTLTAIKVSDPAHGTVTLNSDGSFVYVPVTNYFGADSFTYQASDGLTNSATVTVTLTITNINRAPVANADAYTSGKNTTLNVSAPGVLANDTDADVDTLTAVKITDPAHGTLTLNSDGSFIFVPVTNYFGPDSFTYHASDGLTNSATMTVTLTITNINRAPAANADAYTLGKNTALNVSTPGVLGNDTDADLDTLTAVKVSDPAHGTLTLNTNGSFTYKPASNYFGADSFTYQATDGMTNSAAATVTLTVTNINYPPVLGNDTFTNNQNIPFTLPFSVLLTNDYDPDGDPLTVFALSTNSANGGRVTTTSTNFTYRPPTNFVGNDTFLYMVSDGHGGNSTGTVFMVIVLPQFSIHAGTNVFNPQTGLFEQSVTVTNTGGSTAAAVRLFVTNINSTNGTPKTNVYVYNASGTNAGTPYVQYNSPLDPGNTVTFLVEFYDADRRPFTNSYAAQEVLPAITGTNAAVGVPITREFMDFRTTGVTRFVVEFSSTPGKAYTILYGPTVNGPWSAATPSITANATKMQWYDDGPPKTATPPLSVTNRFYRVLAAP